MHSSLIVPILAFLTIWGACFILAVALLNFVFFNMDRSRLKKILKLGDFFVLVVAPPVLLLAFRDTALVSQILALRPITAAAYWILALAGICWSTAFLTQLLYSIRTLRKKNPIHVLSNHTRVDRFHAREKDWDVFNTPDSYSSTEPLPPDAPSIQRPVTPIPHRSLIRRMIMRRPLSLIDKSYDLHIHEITLEFSQLPAAFSGLRVLHLADSHYGALLSPRYYEYVVEKAAELAADLIVLTGDYTAADHLHRESVALFRSLRAPLGVWTVLGNHDYYTEANVMGYWIRHYGINLITNKSTEFRRNGEVFRLVGTEHPYQPVDDWDALVGPKDEKTFCLALSHRPENVVPLARAGADFVLSGHTHGGQWRLPLIGPIFIPSFYGRYYDQGFFQVGRALLYISKGVGGHTFPLRLNCAPEISLFELRRPDNPRISL